jgi:hypothetical protein
MYKKDGTLEKKEASSILALPSFVQIFVLSHLMMAHSVG